MSKLRRFVIIGLIGVIAITTFFAYCTAKEVPVLMYHFIGTNQEAREDSLVVSQSAFELQLKRLQAWGYHTWSLEEYYAYWFSGKRFPGKVILITFDDGNFSFNDYAFPLLSAYQMKAANFLVADSLLHHTHGSMTSDQAKHLLTSPLISFGSHSTYHGILKGMSDQELNDEIAESKKTINNLIGQDVAFFCYPGGYYDDRALSLVKEAGYKMAFATSYKRLEGRKLSEFSIPRIKITEKDGNPILFWMKISGVYSAAQSLRYQLLSLFHLS